MRETRRALLAGIDNYQQASRVTAPSIYTYVERRFGGWPHVVLDGAPFAHG